ncbi:MAG: hypothetical protein KatS3mg115_1775 [Candidatus Poribacteria bacterium]|nr:MAG: hypothetical protein KatS3mg115_1775 [Candidatus Poribacteria bacterium]
MEDRFEIELGTHRNWMGSAQLRQTLFTWGRALNAYRQFQLQHRAAEFALERAKQTVALQVQEAFYGVLLARTVVEVSQAAVEQAQRRLDVAQKRYEAGTTTRLEVLQAQVGLSTAQAQRIRAENALQIAKQGFVLALGLAPNNRVEAIGNLEPIAFEGELNPLIEKALLSRPDLREALYRDEANRYLIKIAAAGNKPIVAATATWAWTDTERQNPQNTWSVGVGINFPIFDGVATRAQKRQAEAAKRQSEQGLSMLKSGIVFEVQRAYRSFIEAQTLLEAQADALSQAEEALRIANLSFANGVITGVELAEAELGTNPGPDVL